MFFPLLISLSFATENTLAVGVGPYFGGLRVGYTYEPIVGLGIHAGAGFGGLGLGVRWLPEWLSGGYSQVGLARTVKNTYAPNIMIGKKFGDSMLIDFGGGLGANIRGQYGIFFHLGAGITF